MAVAQGSCPSCGAPIEFGVGSSLAKICEYCNATVVRSDRGLENLGKVAEIANTPSLIAVGDEGMLAGRQFMVMGRVQLDHGKGPWDEYYVALDNGQSWGWLAYAMGQWHVTQQTPGLQIPPFASLQLEMDVPLGPTLFRVAEIKTGRVVSAEGELPSPHPSGTPRYYADCYGRNNAFATLDYGDNTGAYEVYQGWVFDETQLQVTELGPRSAQKVKTEQIKCPQCGGDLPKLSGERASRLGCPYCGAVSDIASQQVVAQQEAAMQMPDIPIGSRGTFDGVEYICIAYLRRSSDFEGSRYGWEEYLLWSQPLGYRWLIKDPETGWSWTMPANLADLDLYAGPEQVAWGGRYFSLRNQTMSRVDYVLGEVYWQCEVGEQSRVSDFVNGDEVLSREESPGEVRWSYTAPIAWPVIAQGFQLPLDGPGSIIGGGAPMAAFGEGKTGGCAQSAGTLVIVGIVLVLCMVGSCSSCGGCTALPTGGGSYRGGGVYFGGK
jgi:ssDNA-binding Zn-finger/Zn-ribbon topoisomerase 1